MNSSQHSVMLQPHAAPCGYYLYIHVFLNIPIVTYGVIAAKNVGRNNRYLNNKYKHMCVARVWYISWRYLPHLVLVKERLKMLLSMSIFCDQMCLRFSHNLTVNPTRIDMRCQIQLFIHLKILTSVNKIWIRCLRSIS